MFYFKDTKQVTVYFADSSSAVWSVDNPVFEKVCDLCKRSEWIEIEILRNKAKALMNNEVEIKNNKLIIKTENKDVTIDLENNKDPIISFIKLLKDKGTIDTEIERIKPFLHNMFQNPFINAVEEIYDYCKAMDFEITEDGCFIAYKNVRSDLGSIWDKGKTKHTIGEVTKVTCFDTDRNKTCSNGLHFCSKEYLKCYWGDVTLAVKVNPKHVVAIPVDYNNQKGRCCEYIPIGILDKDAELATTDIEKMTNDTVKVIKSNKGGRINETASLMRTHKDVFKVANIMMISVETVRRNIRKYKQAYK